VLHIRALREIGCTKRPKADVVTPLSLNAIYEYTALNASRDCKQTPHQHVEAVRHWKLTWAWPHDGRNQTLAGAGVPLMRQYADAGLDMMHEAASFPTRATASRLACKLMLDRMRGGRLKVFKGQNEGWLEEIPAVSSRRQRNAC
jgi:hypothetical protein